METNEIRPEYTVGMRYYLFSPKDEEAHFVGELQEIDSGGWKLLTNSKGRRLYAAKGVLLQLASSEQVANYF